MNQRTDNLPIFSDEPPTLRLISRLDHIPQLKALSPQTRRNMEVVARILPFRVNKYVLDNLIHWEDVPNDPIFQLVFPQPTMLSEEAFRQVADAMQRPVTDEEMRSLIRSIRHQLNPHPAGQQSLNVPRLDGMELHGLQHKYRETLLVFPSQGQTCHSYCTFCFRWAQFVHEPHLKMQCENPALFYKYLRTHGEIRDLLVTGGDPLVMSTSSIRNILDPLRADEFDHVSTIRIGTKSLSFWPYRFVTDPDADALLHLFEELVNGGKRVAIMAHFDHPRELDPAVVGIAIRRLLDCGVEIRTQAPVLKHVNACATTWKTLWNRQMTLGLIPYYMFVARNTGGSNHFELPLINVWDIYRQAFQELPGLTRAVRGPCLSTTEGKIEIQGVVNINGQPNFCMRYIQARNTDYLLKPFFMRVNSQATWLDQLELTQGFEGLSNLSP
jgi:KamA family protein